MSCCNNDSEKSQKETIESVKEYYGEILKTTKDLKTNACTTAGAPPLIIREAISKVPKEVLEKYYGCGSPLPTGLTGLSVLDLGSGSGRDCYIAANLVGEKGKVVGIDMTDEQLDVAKKYKEEYCKKTLGYSKSNLSFTKGFIEDIKSAGIVNESVDLVISNCVVNLSPNKEAVIKGVYDALKYGGEFYFSDVYSDRRIPKLVREHKILWGECISGALYIEDFKRICSQVGFKDVRMLSSTPILITDPELKDICGNTKFYSITYRCFKLPNIETLCEDYGQIAVYKGTLPGHLHGYKLDDHHFFQTNKPMLVCGNSAGMVGESWLKPHFNIIGDRSVHYGLFEDCSKPMVGYEDNFQVPPSSGCC